MVGSYPDPASGVISGATPTTTMRTVHPQPCRGLRNDWPRPTHCLRHSNSGEQWCHDLNASGRAISLTNTSTFGAVSTDGWNKRILINRS